MKVLIILISTYLILLPFLGISQWNHINQGNIGDYRVIKFNNESDGWAMGDSCFIQKTINGGDTWIQVECNGIAHIEDFHFVNDSVAYCTGWYYNYIKKSEVLNYDFISSEVLKYNYINESWNVICTLDSVAVRALHFLDPLTGFIVSAKGIQKTDDGGISWSIVWDAPFIDFYRAYLRDIIFVNDSIGFACGRLRTNEWDFDLRKVILKTTDKGENWFISYIDTTSASHTIYRLHYANDNPNFIYGSTSSSSFFKTSNCGDSWELIGSDIIYEYKPIYFISADTGYVAATPMGSYTGDKTTFEIWRTIDGALTWDLQFVDSAYTRATNSIYFVNDTVGYVAGRQTMLKTENGGVPLGINLYEGINVLQGEVFPNPTNEVINFQFKNPEFSNSYSIELRNLYGQLAKEEKNIQSSHYALYVADLKAGVYFYVVRDGDKVLQQGKVMVK